MKNIRLIALTAAALILTCSNVASCGGEENPGQEDTYSVSGVILKASEAAPGENVSFDYLRGEGPELVDKAVLQSVSTGQEYQCRIADVAAKTVTITLPSDIVSGDYKLFFVHGGKSYQVPGSFKLSVRSDAEVKPADGATVYGIVHCGGKGIAGAVVSDGHEVVVTDKDGIYQLKSEKVYNDVALNVFVSTPSGYEPQHDGILPKNQKLLSKGSAPERVDFELVKTEGQDKHTLLVMGDMHLAKRTNDINQFSQFRTEIIEYTEAHKSDHVYGLTLGDMSWDLYWYSNSFNLSHYVQTMSSVKDLIIYHCMGNHDYDINQAGDDFTTQPYRSIIGPTYYSFNAGKVHYIVLDDILTKNTGKGTSESRVYSKDINGYQIEWLKKDLQHVSKDTPLVITLHGPVFTATGGNSCASSAVNSLLSAISGYKTHIFSGHTHVVYNVDQFDNKGYYEHNSGAVCATWWWSGYHNPGINISTDGTPGGYYIVDVNGKDFKWQYKSTGKDLSHQMRAYDRNSLTLTADIYCPKATDARKAAFNGDASDWADRKSDNMV
ncbi:MAG: calcineurin-like phosphoesterase C-terminal domain-containing protein, partial [Bacteroidales bacterium]|nr:calcineurin-like phosphoesterase C-terminal domain-containing protein [Bacteroidales bacterium]